MSFNKKGLLKEVMRRTSYKPDDSQRLHILDFLRLVFLRNPAGLKIWNNLYPATHQALSRRFSMTTITI